MQPRRRGFLVILGTFVLLVPLLGSVGAQGGPFYQVTTEVDAKSRTIGERFGTAEFEVTVTTTAQQSAGCTSSVQIQYTVENISPAPPDGWGAATVTPSTRTVPACQSFTVSVSVSLTSNDPAADEYPLKLRVTAQPTSDNPALEALYGNLNQRSQDETDTMTAKRQLTTPEAVTAFADQYKFFLLAGVAGLFLVAILLVRKKKGLELRCDQPSQEVLPGRGASFPVHVTNAGSADDKVYLTTSDVPQGWGVLLPVETMELQGAQSDLLWVTVRAPHDARLGERVKFELYASSRTQPGQEASVSLEAAVVDRYTGPGAVDDGGPVQAPPSFMDEPTEPAAGPPVDLEIHEPKPLPAKKKPKSAKRR